MTNFLFVAHSGRQTNTTLRQEPHTEMEHQLRLVSTPTFDLYHILTQIGSLIYEEDMQLQVQVYFAKKKFCIGEVVIPLEPLKVEVPPDYQRISSI